MNNIHTVAHIRTPRMLKGFRSCINMTGESQIFADLGRVFLEEFRRLNRVQNAISKRLSERTAL